MQVDNATKANQLEDLDMDETTAADEKAPFKLTIDERVAQKFQKHKIELPKEILSWKEDRERPEQEGENPEEQALKATKQMHYDKEDLISFHQLFISKPLTKAAADLDYEHPTVI